ncbi:MAG: hypothetical protein AABY84_04950 [Candidatus Firestonebacteria bacterium]
MKSRTIRLKWTGTWVIVWIFIFITLAFVNAQEKQEPQPVLCTGDYVEYQQDENILYGKGNITLKHKGLILKADEVNYNSKTGEVDAKGNIILTENDNEIHGTSALYNLNKKSGVIKDANFYKKPWNFKGETINKTNEKDVFLNSGYGTTCIYKDSPHYKLTANEIHIEMDESIEAWWTLFYVEGIPIMIIPYFYRSLRDNRNPFTIKPGYSEDEGWSVRTAYNYWFADYAWGAIYNDYIANKGYGKGTDYHYSLDNDYMTGYFYIYHIREKEQTNQPTPTGPKDRLRVDIEHSQYLTQERDINITAKGNYFSDSSMVNNYSTISPIMMQEINSYVALSKRYTQAGLFVSVDRNDLWETDRYVINRQELPKATLDLGPFVLDDTNIYYGLSTTTLNRYIRTNDYYVFSLDASPNLTHSFNLTYRTTLTENITFKETWQDLPDKNQDNKGFTSSYTTFVNLHHIWNQVFSTDLRHSLAQRLTRIESDENRGVISNRIDGAGHYMFYPFVSLDISTGYDLFSRNSTQAERFYPITGDLRATPHENVDYYLNTSYNLALKKIANADTYIDIGRYRPWSIKVGVNYIAAGPYDSRNNVDLNLRLGIALGQPFRVILEWKYDTYTAIFKEQKYMIHIDITDCWELELSMTNWGDSTNPLNSRSQFWFALNLRAFAGQSTGGSSSLSPFSY